MVHKSAKCTVWKRSEAKDYLVCDLISMRVIDYATLNWVDLEAGGRREHGLDSSLVCDDEVGTNW